MRDFLWRLWFLFRLLLASVAILVGYYRFLENNSLFIVRTNRFPEDILDSLREFALKWCKVRRAHRDVETILKPCRDLSWNPVPFPGRDVANQTDASKSEISLFEIRPAGEFSRFVIQSKTSAGRIKSSGGDFWRILLRGPATISPTVFDLSNGSYEVLFLVVEAGIYSLDVTLDYSLCDGYRDPPKDWFIIGNRLFWSIYFVIRLSGRRVWVHQISSLQMLVEFGLTHLSNDTTEIRVFQPSRTS